MKEWPALNESGDLPPGIHSAKLAEVTERFGKGSLRRATAARRLERIHSLVVATGHLARFIVFGSFITAKPEPNDVDIFVVMDDDFDVSKVTGEAAILFDHLAAQNYEGASIFWVRALGALGGEQAAVEDWQIKRDGTRRGVVEITAP
jgi:predicted nucleotidyltransferase